MINSISSASFEFTAYDVGQKPGVVQVSNRPPATPAVSKAVTQTLDGVVNTPAGPLQARALAEAIKQYGTAVLDVLSDPQTRYDLLLSLLPTTAQFRFWFRNYKAVRAVAEFQNLDVRKPVERELKRAIAEHWLAHPATLPNGELTGFQWAWQRDMHAAMEEVKAADLADQQRDAAK